MSTLGFSLSNSSLPVSKKTVSDNKNITKAIAITFDVFLRIVSGSGDKKIPAATIRVPRHVVADVLGFDMLFSG